MDESKNRQIEPLRSLIVLIGIVTLVAFAYAMKEVLASVTIAIVLFYILDPMVHWLEQRRIGRRKISRLAAVLLVILFVTLALTGIILALIPPIADQVERFSNNIPEYIKHIESTADALQQKYKRMELPFEVRASLKNSFERITAESMGIIRQAAEKSAVLFSQIILLFMMPFITFYLLLEKNDVKNALVSIFPKKLQSEIAVVVTESSRALHGYITGQLILSALMGVAMTLALSFMGVKAPLLLGMIAGVTKLIPVIGIVLGCIPAAIVALSDSVSLALWVVLVFSIVQLLENKVILPLFLSKYVTMSPLAILLTIMVGEQLGGVLGMFIATPIAAVLNVFYKHLRTKYI